MAQSQTRHVRPAARAMSSSGSRPATSASNRCCSHAVLWMRENLRRRGKETAKKVFQCAEGMWRISVGKLRAGVRHLQAATHYWPTCAPACSHMPEDWGIIWKAEAFDAV